MTRLTLVSQHINIFLACLEDKLISNTITAAGRHGHMATCHQPPATTFNFQLLTFYSAASCWLLAAGITRPLVTRAANDPSVVTITEKAPTRAFSWLKASISAFTCKTLC